MHNTHSNDSDAQRQVYRWIGTPTSIRLITRSCICAQHSRCANAHKHTRWSTIHTSSSQCASAPPPATHKLITAHTHLRARIRWNGWPRACVCVRLQLIEMNGIVACARVCVCVFVRPFVRPPGHVHRRRARAPAHKRLRVHAPQVGWSSAAAAKATAAATAAASMLRAQSRGRIMSDRDAGPSRAFSWPSDALTHALRAPAQPRSWATVDVSA